MNYIHSIFKTVLLLTLVTATPGCKWFGGSSCGDKTCATSTDSHGAMKEVSAEQLKEKMASTVGLMVINVLSAENYKDCHIKGSLNVPMADLAKASETWDKNQEIITYCAKTDCPASKDAQALLQSKGFTNVAHFAGGSKEWKAKGFPTEGECKAEYLK